jgi:hypothetical protein
MRFGDRLKRLFGGSRPGTEMVPFLDTSGRVLQIPVSELQPGMTQIRIKGREGLVWVRTDRLKPGREIRHPPFDEGDRTYIRRIQEAFAEHRSLSFEEWEDGFRRDANAEYEIAIWSYAADVYRAFADNEVSPERRRDIYRVIVTCLTASPEFVWRVLKLEVLSRPEAEEIVKRVYGKHYRSGAP